MPARVGDAVDSSVRVSPHDERARADGRRREPAGAIVADVDPCVGTSNRDQACRARAGRGDEDHRLALERDLVASLAETLGDVAVQRDAVLASKRREVHHDAARVRIADAMPPHLELALERVALREPDITAPPPRAAVVATRENEAVPEVGVAMIGEHAAGHRVDRMPDQRAPD